MGNMEKNIIENVDNIRKTNVSGFRVAQRGFSVEDEGSLKRELKEDSIGKAHIMEVLVDWLVGELSRSKNYKTIDSILGKEGASQELADRLWKYSEKLGRGSKHIIPGSNARDMFMNLYQPLLGFIHTLDVKTEKLDKLGFIENKERETDENNNEYKELKAKHEKLKNSIEVCKEGIVRSFNELNGYLNLLEKYEHFETAELNSEHGYLTGKLNIKELESLKAERGNFIKRCEIELTKN